MSFLSPIFAWTFAALIPLALLYLLKVRARKAETTAWFLWQRVLGARRRSALFQRLRDVLSLLLMAAAFSCVALALMEPRTQGEDARNILIILDRSASMQAREGGRTRLDLAKERAAAIIRGLRGMQEAALAVAAREVAFSANLTRHQRSLLDALDAARPSDLPLDARALADFLATGATLAGARVIFLTDGCSQGMDGLPPSCEIARVGSPTSNAGIIAADMKPIRHGAGWTMFLRVRSGFKEIVKTEIAVTYEESQRLVKVAPLELPPSSETRAVIELPDAPAGRWTAKLALDDPLPLDNTAFLIAPETPPVTVAVAGEQPFFFTQAVNAFAQGQQALRLADDPAKAQIVISARDSGEGARSIIFNPEGESPWWKNAGPAVTEPVIPRWKNKQHPLVRWLDAEGMDFTGARKLEAPAGSLVLVESEEGLPLIYLARQPDRSAVVVNLDPAAASFYLSAWFPVLVHNAATVLGGREQQLPDSFATGALVPLSAPVTLPDGTEAAASPAGFIAEQRGFYLATQPPWQGAASLLSTEESALEASDCADTLKPLSTGRPWSYALAVACLVVLAAESALYHRRKVG